MTDYEVTGGKESSEDPVRLRECLNALSEACGHDVFRVEALSTGTGIRILVTCSKSDSEEEVGLLVAGELARYMGLGKR